jgi:hypothetical protein
MKLEFEYPIEYLKMGFGITPDQKIALAMGLHKRLGEESPIRTKDDHLLEKIVKCNSLNLI